MNTQTIKIAEHSTVAEWAEKAVEALPSIVATAAAIAGLADAAWTPMVTQNHTGVEVMLTGQLVASYSDRPARLAIAKYAREWGDGHYEVRAIKGRLIASAMIKVEGYAPARVWADTGPALSVVREHYEREAAAATAAELGPGVG